MVSNHRARSIRVICSIIFILTLPLLFIQDQTEADPNPISFHPAGRQTNETHVLYEGEDSLLMSINYPVNCTFWSLELNSDLFQHPFIDHTYEKRSQGDNIETRIDLNPDALIGQYHIDIFFNFTDELGDMHNIYQSYDIDYVQIFIIKNQRLPSGDNKQITLVVEFFEDCQEVNLTFTSLEFWFDNDNIIQNDLDCGTYVFKSNIGWIDPPIKQPSIGYNIIVHKDNRTLIKKVHLVIDWEEEANASYYKQWILISLIFSMIIILVSILTFLKRKHEEKVA